MAIFGTGNITEDTVGHNGTTADVVMNYFYGSLLVLSLPMSMILNPVVFLYNFKQKLSLGSALFMVLSGMDFLFSFRTLTTAFHLLKPELEPLFDPHPTQFQRFQGFLGYTFGYTSMFVTMTLCVVRYIKIRVPFWSLSHGRIIAMVAVVSIIVDCTYSTVVGGLSSFLFGDIWMSVLQGIISSSQASGDISTYTLTSYLIVQAPFYIKIGVAVIFSFLTVLQLRQSMSESTRRSMVMILLLNVGNVVWFVSSVITNVVAEAYKWEWDYDDDDHWTYEVFYVTFFDMVVAQCLLAAYNPLIFCVRVTGVRTMMRKLFLTGKMEIATSEETITNSN